MHSIVSKASYSPHSDSPRGEFLDFAGERFYVIRNLEGMAPFFVSVVSSDNHWLFASSTGGLTAGRESPDFALFPYVTVDKLHDSSGSAGPRTILRIRSGDTTHYWEPFNREQRDRYGCTFNLYKNALGNKLCFEAINRDLELAFRYTWSTSAEFGFVRHSELENLADTAVHADVVDGVQNILPAGTPILTQTNSSNLVDAYKWTELDESTGLAFLTLYSGITDRAEPCESLKATTAFSLGLEDHDVLISSGQLDAFRAGRPIVGEQHNRGVRGAYFVSHSTSLPGKGLCEWRIVLDTEQSQAQAIALKKRLADPASLETEVVSSIEEGSDKLARIMASADGFQETAEENVTAHHCANVLFNVLRGGIFDDQYNVSARDFRRTIRHFNAAVLERHRAMLDDLPERLRFDDLLARVRQQEDPQLERLALEYLPITFGRRHGDPSRPWNLFAIRLKDENGEGLLSYQGNWRDIFQNWEALAFSYPAFIENMIAKFVNASTLDGYNPYRITKEGIDWEVEEPDNPWSYIGYWGDHQIIYLLKLLELSQQFHPGQLTELLRRPIFCYANVPYRIRSFEALLENSKATVDYDESLAERIEERVAAMGADGKLALDESGAVYQVNLLEKLLVPLLAKLSNLVVDGGIWLNTQRPEWNDANNALVGQGLSMVTLYYMRRYVRFLRELLAAEGGSAEVSNDVAVWLDETSAALRKLMPLLGPDTMSATQQFESLAELGRAASQHRDSVYARDGFSGKTDISMEAVTAMLDHALAAIDHSIGANLRDDGLYHAYNTLALQDSAVGVDSLYLMLEGQVAALSAGTVTPDEAAALLDTLFESEIYRADQHSFMLYPDRKLPGFLAKNRLPATKVEAIPLLQQMLADDDHRVVVRDLEGEYRFSAEFANVADLDEQLDLLASEYGDAVEAAREPLRALYEDVFNHKAFTGRSGTMFGFEGLGCIYWHMVSKLLLAVQENFFAALENDRFNEACHRLGKLYYCVRDGIGFNKTPSEYGAFPTDPYSHTPRHSGAKQPGMTGQVKEEILTRFGELGIRVADGQVRIRPDLLRACEFTAERQQLRFLDVDGEWQDIDVPARGLAFTWCQVPVIYKLDDDASPAVTVTRHDGREEALDRLTLSTEDSRALFERNGNIRKLTVALRPDQLFTEQTKDS